MKPSIIVGNTLICLVAVLVALPVPSRAALLVYEGFDYSASTSTGNTMNGVVSSALGLQGNYAVLNNNAASATYNSSGLSFGPNYATSDGGSVVLSATFANSVSATTYLGAQLDVEAVSGTLYSSHLVRFTALSTAAGSIAATKVNSASATANYLTGYFTSAADGSSSSPTRVNKPASSYGRDAADYTGDFSISTGITYLVLTKFTNVGLALSVSNPGVATQWLLTQPNYDTWITSGGMEANLSTYASATVTTSLNSGTFNFNSSDYLQAIGGSGSWGTTETATIDEIRYGTLLLDVVPEPSTTVLLMLPAAAFLLIQTSRRRRNALKSMPRC